MLIAILGGFLFANLANAGPHDAHRNFYWLLLAADIVVFLIAGAFLFKLNSGGASEKAQQTIALAVFAIIAAGFCVLSSVCATALPHDGSAAVFTIFAFAGLIAAIACVVLIAKLHRKQ